MEDKWDIDFFDRRLYFSRSWTGDLVIVAEASQSPGVLAISLLYSAVTNPGRGDVVIRDVDFLVKAYLFGYEAPHSLPADLPTSEKTIVTYSFSVFGRAAAFATYDDTTKIPITTTLPPT
jgi:hypothetical protein